MTEASAKKFEEENPDLTDYIKYQLQKAVANICDIVITQYDQQIATNRILIDKLKDDVQSLEKENWNNNTF